MDFPSITLTDLQFRIENVTGEVENRNLCIYNDKVLVYSD